MKKTDLGKISFTISSISFSLFLISALGIYHNTLVPNLQLVPLLQKCLVDFSLISIILLSIILLATLLFGRIYCSFVCPFGIAQELFSILFKKFSKKKNKFYKNQIYKYILLALSFGALIAGNVIFIKFLDPYTIFSSIFAFSIYGILFSAGVLVLTFFKDRYFCSNICPLGALLGLISKFSIFKIYHSKQKCVSCELCSKACPVGCIDPEAQEIDNERCIVCLKCLKACKMGSIKFGIKPNQKIFSITRRKTIKTFAFVALLCAGYKAGLEFSKKTIANFKNIILPAGAKNQKEMLEKCLNCNLCINNCPNKILTKSNKDFPAVHIDYTKGEKYCEFECNNCSQVCPSGAIKKITKEEKQNTRIAIAKLDTQKCRLCRRCLNSCPKGAIFENEKGEILLDSKKCIGCGLCATYCYFGAIEIFPTNEQKLI